MTRLEPGVQESRIASSNESQHESIDDSYIEGESQPVEIFEMHATLAE